MSIKRMGMQDGREYFEGEIRKGHEASDISEIMAAQGKPSSKQRFRIKLDGFSNKESEELIKMLHLLNYYRNTTTNKNNPVSYTNTELHLG